LKSSSARRAYSDLLRPELPGVRIEPAVSSTVSAELVGDYLEHIADAIERAMRYASSLQSLQALEQDESCMTISMWPGM
jgi:hypothetical protein